MSGPHPDVAAVRRAVRRWRAEHAPEAAVAVAVSGGADSLALLAAAVHECEAPVRALVVDHQLQPGSDVTAATAAAVAARLGAQPQVLTVRVVGSGGVEAAARRARYAALRGAAAGAPVLLGHTLDDQAETVLLGLGRGSGPRSLAGMRPWEAPWGRPLLGVRRDSTRAVCAELGLSPHQDPHNDDPAFTRVRLRHEVLPLLEQVLAGGVAPALARTAAQLREDCDALDAQAAELFASARTGAELDAAVLEVHPGALRRRVLRTWLLAHGATALTDDQLRWADELLGAWRGQGGVSVGGGLVVSRARGRLSTAAGRTPS